MATVSTVDEYVQSMAEPLQPVARNLRNVIDAVLPDAAAVWHGHPVWSLGPTPGKSPVCLLKAYQSYVSFGFWRGREMEDPSGRMEVAKGMAHVKLRTPDDIDELLFTDWLQQARERELAALRRG
jgi:hypothetical protein